MKITLFINEKSSKIAKSGNVTDVLQHTTENEFWNSSICNGAEVYKSFGY